MKLQDDITIIVRECGERTADVCAQLLSELFPDSHIHRISACPFHETLRLSLELGQADGRKWTLCIDGDVLVLPEILGFIDKANEMPGNYFEFQALVLDKLIPSRRPAGNHLYKTKMISKALPLIPTDDSMRPETQMIRSMTERGYAYHQSTQVIGMHDFEQSYQDIYAKSFLHTHKHQFLVDDYGPLWELLAVRDKDFQVALQALKDAIGYEGTPEVSRQFRKEEALAALDKLGFSEKPKFQRMTMMEVSKLLLYEQSRLSEFNAELTERIQVRVNSGIIPTELPAMFGSTRLFAFVRRMLRSVFIRESTLYRLYRKMRYRDRPQPDAE